MSRLMYKSCTSTQKYQSTERTRKYEKVRESTRRILRVAANTKYTSIDNEIRKLLYRLVFITQ